jgi:glycerol kinase
LTKSPLYLVLDQGGHASRALIFNTQGEKTASAEVAIATFRSGNQVEHDASELVESLQQAAKQVVDKLGDQRMNIVCAGLATQRSNMLCWRRSDNKPLSPVISWQDRRAADKLEGINFKDVHQKTGLHANPHYGASKMAWCLEHLPEVTQAAKDNDLVMGPMSCYLASQLTSSVALADPANASRTLLWNIHTHDWDDELCHWFDIDKNFLPGCVNSDHGFGKLSLQGQLIPLDVVTGDLSAAAFVNGQPRSDIAYITLGTGGFIQRINDKAFTHPDLLDGMVWSSLSKEYISLEGTVNGAGAAIAWLAQQHNLDESEIYTNLQQWSNTVDKVPLFFNAVSGIGSPVWCAHEQSYFSHQGSVEEQAVAVIESVVFLFMLNMKTMDEVLPKPQYLYLTGGLSNVDTLCQKLADLSELPVQRGHESEGTGRGLAYLLSGNNGNWTSGTDNFFPRDNPRLEQQYTQWLMFMQKHSSRDCLYFNKE